MSAQSPKEWLSQKPFTLALSAGFFGFYAHGGFMAALTEEGLAPSRVTGTSAGAIVGAFYAAGHSSDSIKKILLPLKRADFWDPSPGIGLLRGQKMANLLHQHLPKNFSDLKTPLAMSTFNVLRLKTHVFQSGDQLIDGVRASSAFPGLFQPIKQPGMLLVDGGIRDDMGVETVKPGERVLCHYLQVKQKPNYFEKRSLQKVAGNSDILIRTLSDRVWLGPHLLHRGPDAYDEAYKLTKSWLNTPIVGLS